MLRLPFLRTTTKRFSSTMSTAVKNIDLEITSDSVCPFCYLGYKRILSAIAKSKEAGLPLTFSLKFAPFQLDPTSSKVGVPKREFYTKKFGFTPDKLKAMEASMGERGRADGIEFNYDGLLSNTFESHRLITKAYEVGGEERQRAVVERLFNGYFERAEDLGDKAKLADWGVEAGVFKSQDEAARFFESDELNAEVSKGLARSRAAGITGVPYTVINNKFAVSGAQEAETFYDVFQQLARGDLK